MIAPSNRCRVRREVGPTPLFNPLVGTPAPKHILAGPNLVSSAGHRIAHWAVRAVLLGVVVACWPVVAWAGTPSTSCRSATQHGRTGLICPILENSPAGSPSGDYGGNGNEDGSENHGGNDYQNGQYQRTGTAAFTLLPAGASPTLSVVVTEKRKYALAEGTVCLGNFPFTGPIRSCGGPSATLHVASGRNNQKKMTYRAAIALSSSFLATAHSGLYLALSVRTTAGQVAYAGLLFTAAGAAYSNVFYPVSSTILPAGVFAGAVGLLVVAGLTTLFVCKQQRAVRAHRAPVPVEAGKPLPPSSSQTAP
jgi:hypothetical protein